MPVELWTSEPFLDEARNWVGEAVGSVGMTLTGEWEQPHARPWSSALRFETDQGRVWFKVNGPGTGHEAALTRALARHVPALVPELLAVDPDRGWSLMRDAGPVLRVVGEPDQLWDRWCLLLGEYAEAQLTLADHLDELAETGVERLPPDEMPVRLVRLVDELRRTPVDDGGLTAEEAERFDAAAPTYAGWCAELVESRVPTTVNHDDLHSANVCVDRRGMRIIDWGDADLAHPFATMLATLNSIAWHAGTELSDPRVERVRDAYLEPFDAYGSHEDRVRWVGLARRTGCLGRALSYIRALEGEPASAHAAADWPVRGWLLEMFEL
jgi:hypothetical protein